MFLKFVFAKDNQEIYKIFRRRFCMDESASESKNPKDFWKETIRPRALEILELLSFLGGVTLTALIASGVLALGSI